MHTSEMPESAGELGAPSAVKLKCPKCGAVEVTSQTWESSCGGYEDLKYSCGACSFVRWVDGPDS